MLELALSYAARGWHVFPCWPKTKKPMLKHGWHDATNDPEQVRAWWTQKPDANIAIACGPSGLAVLDVDHGLTEETVYAWMDGLPQPIIPTFSVRTGRRPEFGVQFYFAGAIPDVGVWKLNGCEGQIKSLGGYVMAPGSIHPDSGEAYEIWFGHEAKGTPQWIRELKPERPAATDDGAPITTNRNVALTSIAGKLRNAGLSAVALEVALLQVNEDRCEPPLDEEEVKRIAANASKWALPDNGPSVRLGKGETEERITDAPPKPWRERYLTLERIRDAKPTSFLIEGFLALDSITALAAPVAQRKSIIALNIAHALCTGEALFDYFKVTQKPERVVYLCPEMGLASFSTRLKGIGLLDYVGTTLFCQTMDEESLALSELGDELRGAVVIIDTLTRFVEGDQNSAEAMSRFAQEVFRLKRGGATVVLLHHSIKGADKSLTLDSAMRGSSELAAFVTSCWATRLEDPDAPYTSPSLLVNVKQRDFESKPFKATADKTYRMRIVGEPGSAVELKNRADNVAERILAEILEAHPETGINKLQAALKEAGHRKGVEWVRRTKATLKGTGTALVSAHSE